MDLTRRVHGEEAGLGKSTIGLVRRCAQLSFLHKIDHADLRLIEIPEGGAADLSNEPNTSCPILLWVVDVPDWDLGDLLVRLGLSRSSVEVVEYYKAFVILRKQP